MWLVPLADADEPDAGPKARGLARLGRAGLPVPPGVVLPHRAFVQLFGEPSTEPHAAAALADTIARTQLPASLLAELAALPWPELMVRSSMSLEDGDVAAPGVFTSVRASRDDVASAIAAVWTSALAPMVVAYANARGGAAPRLAVLLQAFVPGRVTTVYTRVPGQPAGDTMWLGEPQPDGDAKMVAARGDVRTSTGHGMRVLSRQDVIAARTVPMDARVNRDDASTQQLASLALAAEAALALARGADVEIVGTPPMLVQARPLVHPTRAARARPPAALMAGLDPSLKWTWDASHNPDPLSPAQEWLVQATSAVGVHTRLAVAARYLYAAPIGAASSAKGSQRALEHDVRVGSEIDINALGAEMFAWAERELPREVLSVDEALMRYVAFARRWEAWSIAARSAVNAAAGEGMALTAGHVATSAVSATSSSSTSSSTHCGAATNAPPQSGNMIALFCRYAMDHLGAKARAWGDAWLSDVAMAWDVAAPTVADGVDAEALLAAAWARPAASRRAVADWLELDDLWFYRAQAMMRRALVARAASAGVAAEDAAWLWPADPLPPPERAHVVASAARRSAERAAAWAPYVTWPMRDDASARITTWGEPVRGVARHWRGELVPPGAILVARAITPAIALWARDVAGIIAAFGSSVDHGAALARELGIPYVIGVGQDALDALVDGALIDVDPRSGSVRVVEG